MNFEYKKVTAIVHPSRLEHVEAELKEHYVHGLTVSEVCGYGEHPNYFDEDWKMPFMRMELFVPSDKADCIAQLIMKAAHTGKEGNGIVAILPVETVYKTRTQRKLGEDEE